MPNKQLRIAANLSLSSYYEGIAPPWALDTSAVYSGTDDAYLVEGVSAVWVVFRGTEWSLKEWAANFNFHKLYVEGLGRVHHGFYANMPKLFELLNEHPAFKDKMINFCGHSRGGALAQIAAVMHRDAFNSKPRVFTFGSPRVGDRSFVRAYGGISNFTTRVVHILDIVPRVPMWNFWHTEKGIRKWNLWHSMSWYYKTVYKL